MRSRALVTVAVTGFALAGCVGGTDGAPTTSPEAAVGTEASDTAAVAEGRTLIDVRTTAEFEDGHIEDAEHIDVQRPDFEARVAELPRDEPYLVYCRTGNRSAQAIDRMRALGFTDLVNGGAYEDLVDAGLPAA